jgi:hypothetical protein
MLDELHLGDAKPWLRYVCTACKAENKVDLEVLRLGSGNVGTDIIHLPACACGVVTFLNRTWDDGPEADDRHRRAVNSLAEYLKAEGQSANHNVAKLHQGELKAGKEPPLRLKEPDALTTDILGRKALAEKRQREHEEGERAAAERKLQQEERAALEEEAKLQLMERIRTLAAKASINKREARPPGTEPTPEELAAELAKNAGEFERPEPPPAPATDAEVNS